MFHSSQKLCRELLTHRVMLTSVTGEREHQAVWCCYAQLIKQTKQALGLAAKALRSRSHKLSLDPGTMAVSQHSMIWRKQDTQQLCTKKQQFYLLFSSSMQRWMSAQQCFPWSQMLEGFLARCWHRLPTKCQQYHYTSFQPTPRLSTLSSCLRCPVHNKSYSVSQLKIKAWPGYSCNHLPGSFFLFIFPLTVSRTFWGLIQRRKPENIKKFL